MVVVDAVETACCSIHNLVEEIFLSYPVQVELKKLILNGFSLSLWKRLKEISDLLPLVGGELPHYPSHSFTLTAPYMCGAMAPLT